MKCPVIRALRWTFIPALVPFLLLTCGGASTKQSREGIPVDRDTPLVVCMLPAIPTVPALTDEARNATTALYGELSNIPGIKVVPMEAFHRVFPKVITAADYEPMDFVRIRSELSADLIILPEMVPEWHTIQHQDGRQEKHPGLRLLKLSAHSGKWVISGGGGMLNFPFRSGSSSMNAAAFRKNLIAELNRIVKLDPRNCKCSFEKYRKEDLAKWDKALSGRKVRPGFQYSSHDEFGSMISETEKKPMPYFLHRPPKFESTGWSYPLLIYLHGTSSHSHTLSPKMIGESPLSAIASGTIKFDDARLKDLNKYIKSSFVLMPQWIPYWEENKVPEAEYFLSLVIETIRKYPVDTNRIYVTGLSQGGFRTWTFAKTLNGKLAAVAPVCGGSGLNSGVNISGRVKDCVDAPVWAFHRIDDRQVRISGQSREIDNMLPGFFLPGDNDVFAGYPFKNRKPVLWKDFRRGVQYMDDHPGSAESDYTLLVEGENQLKWEKGVVAPRGRIGFTVYKTGNPASHCPWPYGDMDLWRWMYDQRLN